MAVSQEDAPCAESLTSDAATFLGPFMVNEFDLLQFLEDCSAPLHSKQ